MKGYFLQEFLSSTPDGMRRQTNRSGCFRRDMKSWIVGKYCEVSNERLA
jgi:hypothetical protein